MQILNELNLKTPRRKSRVSFFHPNTFGILKLTEPYLEKNPRIKFIS